MMGGKTKRGEPAAAPGSQEKSWSTMSEISPPPPPGDSITATVKWFNPTKGFGFLVPDDGSPDVFCHVSAVERAGYDTLPQGATVTCEIAQGQKGPQVSEIHSVDTSTATVAPPARRPAAPPRPRPRRLPGSALCRADGTDRGDRRHGQVLQCGQELRLRHAGWRRAGRVHPRQGARPLQPRRPGASAARAADDHPGPARAAGDQRRADLRPRAGGVRPGGQGPPAAMRAIPRSPPPRLRRA